MHEQHRKVACGKHKEEVIRQLRRLLESESVIFSDCTDADLVPQVHSAVLQRNSTLENLSVVDAIDYTGSKASPGCKVCFFRQFVFLPLYFAIILYSINSLIAMQSSC